MREFDADGTRGQLALARFIGGLVFEINGERDDALISYRHAYDILTQRDEPIPEALQLSLLWLSAREGFEQEHQRYRDQFDREAPSPDPGDGHWLLLHFDGQVSQKTQTHLSVFNNEMDTLITVVMPLYPPVSSSPQPLHWQLAGQQRDSDLIENLERRARQDLDHQRPAILAAATTRAVAKYQMVREAQNQDALLGALTNVATVASEQADLRSWNVLPAYIHVSRATAPLDSVASIPGRGFTYRRPEHAQGHYTVLFSASYSTDVLSFPPLAPAQDVKSDAQM